MNFQEFENFLRQAREFNASDIHLTVGAPTVIRVNGELSKFGEINPEDVNRTILSLMNAEQEKLVSEGKDVDFGFELSDGTRQRVNVFRQGGKLAASIRLLNTEIPTLEKLKMPSVLLDFARKRCGLVLVTGPTGAGKSTTLASLIDYINETRACHIITIEDPIEYKYTQKRATIHQREVGRDVETFGDALRSALREDPDVILIGELRDYETIALALTAAETGHLVLGTLHTASAAQTIDRIIDAGPVHAQEQTRGQLANLIQGIVAQTLIPTADGKGRIAATEVMIGTDAVRNLIRSNKVPLLESTMQSGKTRGMCTMNDSIAKLYQAGIIDYDNAIDYSTDKADMEKKIMPPPGTPRRNAMI